MAIGSLVIELQSGMVRVPGWTGPSMGQGWELGGSGGYVGSSPMPIPVFTSGLGTSPGCLKAWIIMKARIQLMTIGMESVGINIQGSQKAGEV